MAFKKEAVKSAKNSKLNLKVRRLLLDPFGAATAAGSVRYLTQTKSCSYILTLHFLSPRLLWLVISKRTLFINKRFALNEMFQRKASKFAVFYV